MKKFFSFLILVFFLSFTTVSASEFDISGNNVILYNLNDNSTLYEQNANEKTSIASLTKIMTVLVSLDNIDNLDETIVITTKDFELTSGFSKAGFNVGDKVTYLDLIYGALLPSGAEAVNALVNNTLGYDKFITAMNDKAKEIGMDSSSFANPIGKDNELNYSTAKDVAKMLNYALENKTFKKVFTTKEYTATNGLKLKSTLLAYADFLDVHEINGAKSGFTRGAGRCLASITNINDINFMLVVINSSTAHPYTAVSDTLTIYNYYKDNYSYQTILDDNTIIKTIPVKFGKTKEYTITGNEQINKYLKNNTASNLTYTYNGIKKININTPKDTKLGTVSIYNNDELLYTSDVYLETTINYYHPILWLIILIVIIIIYILKKKKRHRRRKRH